MASGFVQHHDSTQYQQTLLGERPQHAWTTPMADQVTRWIGIPVLLGVLLTISGAWSWYQL